ncbi:helix-turn-helix transcriptional regulator [Kribbella solani]|uniref:helix-turn-helix transcriptional regulator n=1 Tax=Kribbella solani TaxID=236067 RepID=UPI0029B560F9|nr:helix-turn-helix transcriptional regulator [Kribbella solani]MDX3003403.1 helix-turn-helix transcriptional regulator [Kribbella solani]
MERVIDRDGLADFLRRRRELLSPADVGLPDGARRRTPGLRREEVAQLAQMSTDYYSRLEQSRGANPSEPIIASLSRALRCDLDERDHLYHLAGFAPPLRRAGRHISPGLLGLVERLTDIPVCICTDIEEVLWQNHLSDVILGVPCGHGLERNLTWRWFTDPRTRQIFPEEDWPAHSASHVAELRATHTRRNGDSDVAELVTALLDSSKEFRTLWESHEVAVHRLPRKRVLNPEVGTLDLSCEVLLTPEADLRVRAFLPLEGTETRDKLALLQVIGTQTFA